MVAIAVFGFVSVTVGETIFSLQQSWRKQRDTLDLIQNTRWAMEFMANELRRAGSASILSGTQMNLIVDPNSDGAPPFQTIEYLWSGAALQRRQDSGAWQELAGFIPNPAAEGYSIFASAGGALYALELRARPRSSEPQSADNRNYTLRTQARRRN